MSEDLVFQPKSKKRFVRYFFFGSKWRIAFSFIAVCLLIGIGFLIYFSWGLPTMDEVINYRPSLRTEVYDRHGQVVHAFFQENREWVPLEKIPEGLQEAIITVEDIRFYKHWGLDARRLIGAALKDLRHLSLKEGASTLTQQLARNAFLHHKKTFSRKIRELLLALKLERMYTKDQILELYLNQIYFGSGCYGVGTISHKYFGKPVSDLKPTQYTFLAGLPKNPEGYNPFSNLERGKARHRTVLNVLVRNDLLTRDKADSLWSADLELMPPPLKDRIGAYFFEEIRKHLVDTYGPEFVYHSGAEVYTTLDWAWQVNADSVYDAFMADLSERVSMPDTTMILQGALLALDPETGGIVSMIGGREFAQSQFNRAMQAQRQPGSSFKPYVYATAIRYGYSPADLILDMADTMRVAGETWVPRNITREFSGQVNLRTALNRSLNAATVRLLKDVGIYRVIPVARDMGLQGELPPYLSLALGTASVTLLEQVAGYNVFNNHGFYIQPYLIEKVVDENGLILETHSPTQREVLTAEEAAVMVSMLRSVMDNGSGYGARRRGFTRPAAGKTGTTNEYIDGWFIGFTPQVTAGVWVGFDENISMGEGMSSTAVALPLWARFMKAIHDDLPVEDFRIPGSVNKISICQISGLIAGESCQDVVTDWVAGESFHAVQDTCTSCAFRLRPRRGNAADVDRIPIN